MKFVEKARIELLNQGYEIQRVVKESPEYISMVVKKKGDNFFVKCFKLREIFRNPSMKRLVNNEIDIAEKFASSGYHTSILLLDKIYSNNILLLFYEHYVHITLDELVSQKQLSEEEIKLVLKDLLRIMHDLRKMGLVHKHLSPDKILVVNKMLKFSGLKYIQPVALSKFEELDHKFILSNYSNMYSFPPEVVMNEFTGYKSQIFCFGVILYFLVHGEYPYKADSISGLRNVYLDKQWKPRIDPTINPEIYYMIQNSISTDYSDRIGLDEIRREITKMYDSIKSEEDNLRIKVYTISKQGGGKGTKNVLPERSMKGATKKDLSRSRVSKVEFLPPIFGGMGAHPDESHHSNSGGNILSESKPGQTIYSQIDLQKSESKMNILSALKGSFKELKLTRHQKLSFRPLKMLNIHTHSLPRLGTLQRDSLKLKSKKILL